MYSRNWLTVFKAGGAAKVSAKANKKPITRYLEKSPALTPFAILFELIASHFVIFKRIFLNPRLIDIIIGNCRQVARC